MNQDYLKSLLALTASGAAGFYLGGRYVGELAQPTYRMAKPEWIQSAQSTLWVALGLCGLCVIAWMAMDYVSAAES